MQLGRIEQTSRNVRWGIISKLIALLVPFLSRTIMLYTLGALYTGINGLFASILQVLNLSELGISSAIVFSLYKPLAVNDNNQICALLNLYKKCYRAIGLIIMIIGMAILPFLKYLIAGELPTDINLYSVYLIILLGTVIGYELFAHCTSLLMAAQRNDIISKTGIVISVVQIAVESTVLILTKNYYIYIIFHYLAILLQNLINAMLCKKIFPHYVCRGKLPKEDLTAIKKNVLGMMFQKIGTVVLKSVDPIVVSAFLGLYTLSRYQNYLYIITSLFGIIATVQEALKSGIGNSIATERKEKNLKILFNINSIYVAAISWCSTCLMCLFQPFMELWVGKKNMLPDEIVPVLVLYFFVYKWCDLLVIFLEAAGLWYETKFIPVIAAVVNLILNISLIQIIGLYGVLYSTIISVLLIYNIGYAIKLFEKYFRNIEYCRYFFKRQIQYALFSSISILIVFLICNQIDGPALYVFFIRGIICVPLTACVICALWKLTPEFDACKQMVVKLISR